MNKKILLSTFSITAALALMAGATFANFTASATNANNTFGAGTLTLSVNPNGADASTPAFTVTQMAPGDSISQIIDLNNTGTINATATFLSSISHSTSSALDLGDKLNLTLINDPDGDDVIVGGLRTDPLGDDSVVAGPAAITSGAWNNNPLGFGINAGTTHHIVATVQFDPGAGDTFQGMNSTFNLNFQTNQ